MALRTREEARAELKKKGVSVTAWALAHGFTTQMVWEVLSGRKKGLRGEAHKIAVQMGLKEGEICQNPGNALGQRRA